MTTRKNISFFLLILVITMTSIHAMREQDTYQNDPLELSERTLKSFLTTKKFEEFLEAMRHKNFSRYNQSFPAWIALSATKEWKNYTDSKTNHMKYNNPYSQYPLDLDKANLIKTPEYQTFFLSQDQILNPINDLQQKWFDLNKTPQYRTYKGLKQKYNQLYDKTGQNDDNLFQAYTLSKQAVHKTREFILYQYARKALTHNNPGLSSWTEACKLHDLETKKSKTFTEKM